MNESTNFLDGFNGIGGIILILLFFIMFGNGGMWGNNNNTVNSDFLYRDITGVNTSVLNSASTTQQDVLENRYANQLAFSNAQKDTLLSQNTLQNQISSCCCENRLAIANQTNALESAMTANTQAILDKLNATEIQNLRDSLEAKDRELMQSNILSINQAQTQNLLSALGQYYPYPPVNPYLAYNTCSNT